MKTLLIKRRSLPEIIMYALCVLCSVGLRNAAATPQASFTANQTTGCVPLNVQFTNTSTGAVSYYWDMGNGNTSTLSNPSNLYTTTGSFTVFLIAIDGSGARDTARYVNYITVYPHPSASFYATS